MRKIAVQKGLENIEQELRARGFTTVTGQGDDTANAIVYSGASCDWEGIPNITNDWDGDEIHPLVINAVGMSPKEAADLISSRLPQ